MNPMYLSMAGGLLGGSYQPPTRNVTFNMPTTLPPAAPAPMAPGGGIAPGTGGTVAPVGNPLNAADIYTGGLAPSYVDSSGFDSGGVYYNPPTAAPVDASLSGVGAGLGNIWDFLASNGGNPYAPSTGNMNDPNYNWDWTTTGDAGGVGNQLAGLLNMGVIGGGGGIGNNTDTQNTGGQGFAPDYLGGGGIGDGTEIANYRNWLL